ncbi:hypothetical protein ACVA51_21885 [Pseudomonas luteola]
MISYITLNNSIDASHAILFFGGEALSIQDYDFGLYSRNQRKVMIGVGLVDAAPYLIKPVSSAAETISVYIGKINITTCAKPYLKCNNHQIAFDKIEFPKGNYFFQVIIKLDTPLLCINDAPTDKVKSIQYSQALSVQILLSSTEFLSNNEKRIISPLYESYGNLGFF